MALLFLTRMGIPYEAVWKAFLESVPNFGGQGDSWMLLFNVYVHPPPNVVLHQSSIFVNFQLPQRAEVEWGQWSVVSSPASSLRLAHLSGRQWFSHVLFRGFQIQLPQMHCLFCTASRQRAAAHTGAK